MSTHHALREYAKLVAMQLPFACAKRLSFEEPEDFRAVLEDIRLVHSVATGQVIADSPRQFFVLAIVAAETFAKERFSEAYATKYRALLPLVPSPEDTKWEKTSRGWVRVLNGWKISATYYPRRSVTRRLLRNTSPAHCDVTAEAYGVDRHGETETFSIAEARKHIDDWARAHDVTEQRRWKIGALVAENGGGK